MQDLGATTTEVVRARASTLDRDNPGWWREAKAKDFAGKGGSLPALAVYGAWGLEIARRRAVDRKLADLGERGAVKARVHWGEN